MERHVDFKLPADGKPISVRLMSALHVPGVGYQLLAVISNYQKEFACGRSHIVTQSRVVASEPPSKSLYYLDLCSTSSKIAFLASLKLWHERLAHMAMNGVSTIIKRKFVKGVNLIGEKQYLLSRFWRSRLFALRGAWTGKCPVYWWFSFIHHRY